MVEPDPDFPPCPYNLPHPGRQEAHVWRIDLDDQRPAVLSETERERAAAMRHAEKQMHYISARTALRLILARYTEQDPALLPIATSAQGKPFLDLDGALQFNLSHAQGKALVAVAQVPVGIDLEFPRAIRQMDRLVADYFSPEEAQEMSQLSQAERDAAFLAAWTRKEACLKATGEGIGGGLHRYRVTLRPHEKARLVAIEGSEDKARAWSLHGFAPFTDAQAALCLQAENTSFRGFTF